MCIRDRLKEEQKLIEPQIKSLHKQISDVDCKIDEINSVIRVYNSVSYTHLDVYKRQSANHRLTDEVIFVYTHAKYYIIT